MPLAINTSQVVSGLPETPADYGGICQPCMILRLEHMGIPNPSYFIVNPKVIYIKKNVIEPW